MLKKVIREKDKEKLDMNVFKELGKDLNYKDILQVDGAFSACHINYGKSLKFNGADSKNMAQNSRKNSLTENGHIDDLEAVQYDFNGTEKDFKKQDIILLWEKYWLEYINAFNKLVAELPDSIVTLLFQIIILFVGIVPTSSISIGDKLEIVILTNIGLLSGTIAVIYSINKEH